MKRIVSVLLGGMMAALSAKSVMAGDHVYPITPVYKEECASCHVAYPPGLLSAESWRAVMAGLDRHFGSDASLDPAKAKEITQFLEANAARKSKYAAVDAKGKPLLRITDGDWFQREHRDGHDGLSRAVWSLPSVKSAANCAACHRGAEQGSYAEGEIRLPRS